MTKGTLIYEGWDRNWYLHLDDGTNWNMKILVESAFKAMDGKSASQVLGMDSYELKLDDESQFVLSADRNPVLDIKAGLGFGFTNVGAYFSNAMEWLNGRKVIVTIDTTGFKIQADPEEKVHELKFSSNSGNLCNVSKEDAISVCLIGQGAECCIFLMGGWAGFSCAKFSSLSRELLARCAEGSLNAKRIGNCAVVGRENK